MTQQSGGGGGSSYPDVTADGQTPGGLDVLGRVVAHEQIQGYVDGPSTQDSVSGKQVGPLQADNEQAALAGFRQSVLNGHVFTEAVIYAQDLSPSAPPDSLLYRGYSGTGQVFEVNNAGGVGLFGHAAPTAASVISGALSTVTDAAAKAVLTSIIAALTADGGATDGTT